MRPIPRSVVGTRRAADRRRSSPTDRVRASLAAHAPYSVAPLVLRAIRRALDRDPFAPCSVHLSESAEEVEFIRTGGGPWRELLEELGAWDPAWRAPGVSPVQYLDESGFLDGRVLAVHGVQMTPDDLARLAARGATLVTCPRSNGHTGAGAPPIEEFYASGVRVAVGTDSLASTPDLNLFAELATMRALAPSVPAARCSTARRVRAPARSASTPTTARSNPASVARLLAVDMPPRIDDVEEYLVSGIEPEQIRWIGSARQNAESMLDGMRMRVDASIQSDIKTCRPSGASLIVCDLIDAQTSARLPVVRPVQPLGVRAAVCAGRRAAAVARTCRSRRRRIGLDPGRDGGGAQRGDGLQPPGRRAVWTR